MKTNLCICGQKIEQLEDFYCQSCYESLWQTIKKRTEYLDAIDAAYSANPDFDQLEPAWGL